MNIFPSVRLSHNLFFFINSRTYHKIKEFEQNLVDNMAVRYRRSFTLPSPSPPATSGLEVERGGSVRIVLNGADLNKANVGDPGANVDGEEEEEPPLSADSLKAVGRGDWRGNSLGRWPSSRTRKSKR